MKTFIHTCNIAFVCKMKTRYQKFYKQTAYTLLLALLTFSVCAQVPPVSATSTLGTTSTLTYATLKLAFDAINSGTHQGVISIQITGNTTETATAVLNASGSGAASYSAISIQPSGGAARDIAGALAAPLIDLNGADNVAIDGLNTGGNSLTISNSVAGTNTCTIRFISDATTNTIQNCTITGSGTTTTYGTIFFSTGSSAGNSNNIITSNNIGSTPGPGTTPPVNAIYSGGTASNPNINVTISNNNIFNYTAKGIDISQSGSSAWTISGNSFYKEAGVFDTYNNISAVHAIRIYGGSGYSIVNNYIGGEGGGLSGNIAVYTTNNFFSFTGILLTNSSASAVSTIKGNIIGRVAISIVNPIANALTTFSSFTGIETSGTGINVGGSLAGEGNTVGSNTLNGAVSFSTSTTSTSHSSTIYGIYFHSSGGILSGNQVAGIDINNVGTSPASTDFRGIYVSITTPPSQVNNNTVGSTTTTNSIRVMATSTAIATNLTGIYLGSTIGSTLAQVHGNIVQNISHLSTVSSGTFTGINTQNGYVVSYQNNTIKNIYAAANASASSMVYTGIITSTSLSPNTVIANNTIDSIDYRSSGIAAKLRGMEVSGSSPKVVTFSGNTISNLFSLSQKPCLLETDEPKNFTVIGLLFSTGGSSSIISNNNIYNLSSLSSAATNTAVAGIGVFSPGGGNIYGNRISGLVNSATGTTTLPGIAGIKAFDGAFNVYNNSVKISNGAFTNGVSIYGILQNTSGTTWNYFHNSVSISGSCNLAAARTAAFIRTTEGGLLLKNNVFVNTRTGTGTHYAISNRVATPSTTWLPSSSDYNDLYSNNAGTVGEWGTGASNSFAQFVSNSGGEVNSINRPVSFIASLYDLQTDPYLNCGLENAGTPISTPVVINTDLNIVARSASTPDLGAYEYTYIAPVHTASNDGPKCIGGNTTLNVTVGAGNTPFTYSWTGPDSFTATSQQPLLSNTTLLMNGAYTVTATDANGCSASAQTTVASTAAPAGTLTSDPGNSITKGSAVVFTATDGNGYNFTVNGNSVQTGSTPTYTSSTLSTGDIITVAVSNANGCSSSYTGITMSVTGVTVNGKSYMKWNGRKIKRWNGVNKVD